MPRTSRPLRVFPIVLRRVEVARVADLTPNMRRVTLTGDELRAGEMGDGLERPPFRSLGFDDHVKLVVPPAEGNLPPIGTQEEKRFAWNPEAFGFTRDYTVRSWDPDANVLDIDIVRHDQGLAAAWAYRAQPGDTIHLAGPKSCALVNDEAEWHLLIGDETALPAIGRWLDEAPPGTRGHVIIEVPTEADRQEIGTAADVDIEWLVRGERPAGSSPLLFEAVKRTEIPRGRTYAWCAGEAMTIAPIRRYLRGDVGLPKEDVEVVGYWRLPKAATGAAVRESQDEILRAGQDGSVAGYGHAHVGHDAPGTVDTGARIEQRSPGGTGGDDVGARQPAAPQDDDESSAALLHEVHEMTELAPPIVTRVAVTLGIGMLIASGVTTLDGLSQETGVDPARLKVLLDAMTALGLLGSDANGFYNTAHGGVLMEPSATDELSLDNPVNRDALALVDLLDVLRSGRPAGQGRSTAEAGEHGWRERRATDAALDAAYQDRNAEALHFVLEPLSQLVPVAEARTLAICGDAAPMVAGRVAQGRTVHLPGSELEKPWSAHDCALLISMFEGRSDAEAEEILQAAFASGPAVVVVERMADKAAADDHVAEYALTSLALTGSPLRTSADVEELLRRAGARSIAKETLGWGFGPFGQALVAHV